MTKLLGNDSRKFNPKLRMIANSSTEVNTLRSEQCAALGVEPSWITEQIHSQREDDPIAVSIADLPSVPKRVKLDALAEGVLVNVFIETQDSHVNLPNSLQRQGH